jgi:hypothetical protein
LTSAAINLADATGRRKETTLLMPPKHLVVDFAAAAGFMRQAMLLKFAL